MHDLITYDKAKYHFEAVEKEGLDIHQAYVHTGLYLGWLIDHDFMNEEFLDDFENEVMQFKNRTITGPRVYEIGDGGLFDFLLTDEGNAFTQDYFTFETGQYLEDYEALAGELPSVFHVQDTWESYDKLKPKIDERYAVWKLTRPTSSK